MADNRNSIEPPVPPRRTKRKIKTAPIVSSVAISGGTDATKNDARLQQKRPPPPPPPPLPSTPEKCRRNKSRFSVENCQPKRDSAASFPIAESISEQHHRENSSTDVTKGMTESKTSPRSRDDTISASENLATIGNTNDNPVPKSTTSEPSFLPSLDVASSKQSNKYPPLFFTLHDFENVMSSTQNKDDFANASSANLDNSQNLFKKEPSTTCILDENDEVCFRVTTTNFPFEKCLGRWTDPFYDDEFAQKIDDYRFEDSTNGNDQINVRRSSGYDISGNNDDSYYRVGTKVRFVLESPSHSTPEQRSHVKIVVPCDSSRSCKSIFNDEQASEQDTASSVNITEIREEFVNAKDCDDNLQDKSCTSNAGKGNSTREDDLFVLADINKVDAILKTIPQTHYDDGSNVNCEKIRKEDPDLISCYEHVSNENLRIEKKNIMTPVIEKTISGVEFAVKQMDQHGMLDAFSEITENTNCFTDKSLRTACGNEEANTAEITQKRTHQEEKIFFKKTSDDIKEKCVAKNEKIFINESHQISLNEHDFDDNVNQDDDGSSKRISNNDLTNKSLRIEETRRLSIDENNETSDFVDSKNNNRDASPSKKIFEKSVPVKVRRNSFLETMLTDESTDISMNYVISTQTTVSFPNIDKELSTSNELSNKVRESDTNITIEKERSCDFNSTTKVMENQKVLKNSKKTKEKIEEISNINVKSTQLEYKNAGEVKNKVLNELLCNFNTIKLKTISPKNKKSIMKIDGDENIVRLVAINNGISKETENADSNLQVLEESRGEVKAALINDKIIDVSNDTAIVEKIVREEDFTKMKIEKRPQDLKKGICDPVVNETITKNKNIEMTVTEESFCNIKNEIAKDSTIKTEIGEKKSPDIIQLEEIYVKTRIEKTSEDIKSADETKREPKKSRDVRIPKTILKKKSTECERQQAKEFQKRIPIGAFTTMNKIFDSKEIEMIADASRRSSLEDDGKREVVSNKTRGSGEEKTDKEVNANDEDKVDRRRIANQSALALVENMMSSDDKCAIVRKTTSMIPCNNNDNNRAVTPVANVSNDQSSRDVVTITPGKVRSFVKYYEIRSDVTAVERHSKINDRKKVARRKSTKNHAAPVAARNSQRPEVITGRKETEDEDKSVKSNDGDILKMSSNETQLSTFASRVPENPPDDSLCETTEVRSKVMKEYEGNASYVSDKETLAPPAKAGVKKSVQFLGGFTVIHSETFDEKESAEIVADHDSSRKRRIPGISPSRDSDSCQELVREITKSEKLSDTEKSSFQRWETVAQIHAVASHEENSGINRFVPKPETPQLVFYCTV